MRFDGGLESKGKRETTCDGKRCAFYKVVKVTPFSPRGAMSIYALETPSQHRNKRMQLPFTRNYSNKDGGVDPKAQTFIRSSVPSLTSAHTNLQSGTKMAGWHVNYDRALFATVGLV